MALSTAFRYVYPRLQGTLSNSGAGKGQFSHRTDVIYGGAAEGQDRFARFIPVLIGPSRRVLEVYRDGRWKGPNPEPPPIP